MESSRRFNLEGAMFAAHITNNLYYIVNYNKMQSDDLNENIMGLKPLDKKWKYLIGM